MRDCFPFFTAITAAIKNILPKIITVVLILNARGILTFTQKLPPRETIYPLVSPAKIIHTVKMKMTIKLRFILAFTSGVISGLLKGTRFYQIRKEIESQGGK